MRLPISIAYFVIHFISPLLVNAQDATTQERVVQSQQVQRVLEHEPVKFTDCRQKPMGPIETTECNYETIESVNEDLFGLLHDLVKTPFFRYYKVDLYRDCPFWDDDDMCASRDCVITPVDESRIPEKWRARTLSQVEEPSTELKESLPGCYYRDSDYCFYDDDTSGDYIDLLDNPERFTGYAGKGARNIWKAIYEENCFGIRSRQTEITEKISTPINPLQKSIPVEEIDADESEECLEKKVYYKIISGLHASISTHLCYEYLNKETGEWGPNLECFIERVANYPERLEYIYFNTVLILRAISRIGVYLAAYDVCDGTNEVEETMLKMKLAQMIGLSNRVGRFDESQLFRGEQRVLKDEFKTHFRNVSRIMDCVGCMRCRLWGKVQTSGLGTALKILFEIDPKTLSPTANPDLLQRSEVVALINTAHRFVESLHAVSEFRRLWAIAENRDDILDKVEENIKNPPVPSTSSEPPSNPSQRIQFPNIESFPTTGTLLDKVKHLAEVCKASTFWCLQTMMDTILSVLRTLASIFTVSDKSGIPRDDL